MCISLAKPLEHIPYGSVPKWLLFLHCGMSVFPTEIRDFTVLLQWPPIDFVPSSFHVVAPSMSNKHTSSQVQGLHSNTWALYGHQLAQASLVSLMLFMFRDVRV